jgi:branched-chain amino acid transport system ATP-binding protein
MLEISNLRAGYGSINVLWDVSLEIAGKSLTTIVGPNGAGKTTLLRAIMGLIRVTQGDICVLGKSIRGNQTWEMACRGIVMIPEGRMIFSDMTVEENLMMGAFPRTQRKAAGGNLKKIFEFFPVLRDRRHQIAGSLSGGESQMLAIGRGLMADPKIILIDEPSQGLAPLIVKDIFAIFSLLKGRGLTIALVEQTTHMAIKVADYIYLLKSGSVAMSEEARKINMDQLHNLYFSR